MDFGVIQFGRNVVKTIERKVQSLNLWQNALDSGHARRPSRFPYRHACVRNCHPVKIARATLMPPLPRLTKITKTHAPGVNVMSASVGTPAALARNGAGA